MDSVQVSAPASKSGPWMQPVHPSSLRIFSSDQFSSSSPSAHPIILWRSGHGWLHKKVANTVQELPAESSGSTAGPVNPLKICKYPLQTSAPSPTTMSTIPTQQLQLGAYRRQTLAPLPRNTVSVHIFPTQTCPQPHVSSYTMMQPNANQQLQAAFSPCSVNVIMLPPAATPVTPTLAFCSSAPTSNRSGISRNLEQSEETSDTDDCMSTCNSVPKQLSEILEYGRFFVLRGRADHITKSIDDAIWRCEGCDEEEMDGICLRAEGKSARLIFFILDKSTGRYRGVAEMAGHANVGDGNQIDFPVRWHMVKDVSPGCFDGVTYSEYTREHLIRTEIKNVIQLTWKEGLEMIEAIGDRLTRIFRAYRPPTPTGEEMKLRRGIMKKRGRGFPYCVLL